MAKRTRKVSKKSSFEQDFPHYFICFECATSKGGKGPDWPVTCHQDICDYCGKSGVKCAVRDFSWPEYRKAAIWD